LGEDILVQIMERPTLSGDPRIARSLCRGLADSAGKSPVSQPDLMRDAIKRVVRLAAVVSLSSLGDTALGELIAECFARSVAELAARYDASAPIASGLDQY
jgi:hypothetical protein